MDSAQVTARAFAPDWAQLIERSPVATVVLASETSSPWRLRYANPAARDLLCSAGDTCGAPLSDWFEDTSRAGADAALAAAATSTPIEVEIVVATHCPYCVDTGLQASRRMNLAIIRLDDGSHLAHLTELSGWSAVERMLDEQQRFRSALLELSELAHMTEDDDVFYQRLLERAVDVVPGAQGGSVQLSIAGTTAFRFVAAVGYDLDGLKQHVLDKDYFFRDATNPEAEIVRTFTVDARTPEIAEWLDTVGRLSEIKVNVSAPVISAGVPVAFVALDNFDDPAAMGETSVEMTTVLARLIGELWRRRELEAEVRKEREALRHLAMHDQLTGLANRRNLERTLDEAATTRCDESGAAVLFVDIDDFKNVNDRMGHQVGDELLIAVGQGLSAAVRRGDVVGRWGGDEFVVLPAHTASSDHVERLAERILAQFDDPVLLDSGAALRTRVTVGIGWSDDPTCDADTLLRVADHALYDAKAAGKGVARLRTT